MTVENQEAIEAGPATAAQSHAVVRAARFGAKVLGWAEDFVVFLSCTSIAVVILAGIFFRYVLDDPIPWTDEAATSLFVWFVFIGAASVWRTKGHIGIEILVERAPPQARRAIWLFNYAAVGTLLVILISLGLDLARADHDLLTPSLELSQSYIDIAFPIGCGLMLVHTIEHAINVILHVPGVHEHEVAQDSVL